MADSSPPRANPLTTAADGSESPDVPVNAAPEEVDIAEITRVIEDLSLQAQADRRDYVVRRLEENRIRVAEVTANHQRLSTERTNNAVTNGNRSDNLLSRRMQEAIDRQNRGEPVNTYVEPIILPRVERLPRHVTWVSMNRNRRGIEDHPSDEEEDTDEEEVREFAESEDKIIRNTVAEVGSSDAVFHLLAQRLSREHSEVKARYEALVSKENATESSNRGEAKSDMDAYLDKTLDEALAPFDRLFCRRCYIFGCSLHGHSQEIVYPVERPKWEPTEEEPVPCGPNCYSLVQVPGGNNEPESSTEKITDFNNWRTLEKDLFEKGIEIFGRRSCLIARNLLGGLKTCAEVFQVLESRKPT